MSIKKFTAATADYFNGASSADATSEEKFQDLIKNNNSILENLVMCFLWQPEIRLNLNQVVKSPNMPENTVALVTATGTTGQTEPTWTAVGTTLSDGGVTYLMLVDAPIPVTDKEIDNLFT